MASPLPSNSDGPTLPFTRAIMLQGRPMLYGLYRDVNDDSSPQDKALWHALSGLQDLAHRADGEQVAHIHRVLNLMEDDFGA